MSDENVIPEMLSILKFYKFENSLSLTVEIVFFLVYCNKMSAIVIV